MFESTEMEGLDRMVKALENSFKKAESDIVKTVNKSAETMVKRAKNHRFNTKTGDTDRAIKGDVMYKKGDEISLHFYIDPDSKGMKLKRGYNKGWLLNDGWGAHGYKRGAISPAATSKGQERSFRGGDFMGKAFVPEEKKLEKNIQKIVDRLQ